MAATELDLTTGYKPWATPRHEKQLAFHGNRARFRAFVGSIGSGKTLAGIHETMWWLAEPNTVGLAAAPTYPMLTKTILVEFDEIRKRWPGYVTDYNRVERKATFCNGSTLWFAHAADPDSLRGPNLNFFWLDEAALCPKDTFAVLQGRIRRTGRQGGWITTTPKGKNWVHEQFVENPPAGYWWIRARLEDNAHLSPDFLRSLRESYTGPFAAQELDAEFVAFEGLIYPNFSVERHVEEAPPKKTLRRTIVGVDFGFIAPGAMIVLAEDESGRLHAVQEEYHRNLSIAGNAGADWLTIAKELKDEWEPEAFWCDPSAPGSIRDLTRAGIPAHAADNDVLTGIRAVSSLIETDNFRVAPQCVNLQSEFASYQWEQDRDGKPKENERPLKQGDHVMDALRYAVIERERGGAQQKPVFGKGHYVASYA